MSLSRSNLILKRTIYKRSTATPAVAQPIPGEDLPVLTVCVAENGLKMTRHAADRESENTSS